MKMVAFCSDCQTEQQSGESLALGRWGLTLRAVVIVISQRVGILIVNYWAALGDRQVTPGTRDSLLISLCGMNRMTHQ